MLSVIASQLEHEDPWVARQASHFAPSAEHCVSSGLPAGASVTGATGATGATGVTGVGVQLNSQEARSSEMLH
jgi:hypothetical protein